MSTLTIIGLVGIAALVAANVAPGLIAKVKAHIPEKAASENGTPEPGSDVPPPVGAVEWLQSLVAAAGKTATADFILSQAMAHKSVSQLQAARIAEMEAEGIDYPMKWINIIGGVLCAVLIALGQRDNLPLPIPTPIPDAKPLIAGDGIHVLFVEETDDRNKLAASQVAIFTSAPIRKWLVEHKADARFFDKDQDVQFEAKNWQDAMKIPHDSLPWLVISNGKHGFTGPLPVSVDATLSLLEEYK